jgi:hypothetical protein
VQGDRQFDHAEVGTEVTTRAGARQHQEVADFGCERRQFVVAEAA